MPRYVIQSATTGRFLTADPERLEMSSESCSEWIQGAKFNPYRVPPKPVLASVQAHKEELKPQTEESRYEAPKVQQYADLSSVTKAAKTARLAETGAL